MLGYLDPRSGRHQGGGGRDIEGSLAIAAGAAGVDQLIPFRLAQWDRPAHGPHGLDKTGQLFDGGSAGRNRGQQGGDLYIGRIAFEDFPERRACLLLREGATIFDHMLEQLCQLRHGCFYPRALALMQRRMGHPADFGREKGKSTPRGLKARCFAEFMYGLKPG